MTPFGAWAAATSDSGPARSGMDRRNMAGTTWRFGAFEFDAQTSELRRSGVLIKLREQSSRILIYLLEHAGQAVTREELRQYLWPSDTFVDFDHSLNTAVMKLRDALGDSADKPLYIETLPKKGYRFVAPVSLAQTTSPPCHRVRISPRHAVALG